MSPLGACLQAATESPFLDNKMSSATAVLCVLRLPAALMGTDTEEMRLHSSGEQYNEHFREFALRSAIQVGGLSQKGRR